LRRVPSRKRLWIASTITLILGALVLLFAGHFGASARAPSEDALMAAAPSPTMPAGARPRMPPPKGPSGEAPASPDEERELWERRLERAQHTLDSYLQANRYPPESRPIEEQPDQVQPHHVPDVTHPLARKDRKLSDAKVTLRQDRFFLVGDEKVTFFISCENSEGPAPCEVLSSVARRYTSGADAGVAEGLGVPFTDSGQGSMVAVLQPKTQGFADYFGVIRLELELRVDGETGGASFDVQYTPSAPALFTGKVREALEGGSLNLYVEMNVDRPGRYVITARADDAEGQSFAYLSFNDLLDKGRQEVKLPIFGKLVVDKAVRSPFRLRDLEGFLLLENAFPDRELMPAIEGTVYTTRSYALRDFSTNEWESEEKTRHVKEFSKDVEEAKHHVEGEGK